MYGFWYKKILLDKFNKPLLNIRNNIFGGDIKIYAGDNKDKIIADFSSRFSTTAHKVSVAFTNLSTNREYLDFNCETHYRSGGIFYGKEKEGAPMICKILETNYNYTFTAKGSYLIHMAPNVDNALMIAFAIILAELSYSFQNNQNTRHV